MRFVISEDYDDIIVGAGDIVTLKKDKKYKDDITRWLVDTTHRFFVLAGDKNNVLVLVMTTRTYRYDKEPDKYVKITSGGRDALVEMNTWGVFPRSYVYDVTETVSDKEYADVYDKFVENKDTKTDQKLEKFFK